jgi:predicted GNAT superfamily acetyltransferase
MKLKFVIIFIFCINSVYSQNYYGKNNIGNVNFLNDSVCVLIFINDINASFSMGDTCFYVKDGSIIRLSTEIRKQFEIQYSDDKIEFNMDSVFPTLLKKYHNYGKNYKLVSEQIVFYSYSEDCYILSDYPTSIKKDDIIVLS